MDTKKSTEKELISDGNGSVDSEKYETFQPRHVLKDHSPFSSLLSVSDEQKKMLNRVEFIFNSVFKLLTTIREQKVKVSYQNPFCPHKEPLFRVCRHCNMVMGQKYLS